MSVSFLKLLKLPENPLKDTNAIITKYDHLDSLLRPKYDIESSDILTDEVIQSLSKTGLDLDFVVIFRTYNLSGDINERMIHSDITWHKGWKDASFGVNWEIGLDKDNVTFQWWDMTNCQSFYPLNSMKDDPIFSKLSGIHYEKRRNFGVPEQAKLLEEVPVTGPSLVRTDVPHSVIFKSRNRMSLSVRFKQLITWTDAVEAFKSISAY
jgi:hypothetical protein